MIINEFIYYHLLLIKGVQPMEQKKFTFPENVKKEYGLFFGIGVKEFVLYILPTLFVGILILMIPINGMIAFMVKALIAMTLLFFVIMLLTMNPIRDRDNISVTRYLQIKKKYDNRQHLYFKGQKSTKEIRGE